MITKREFDTLVLLTETKEVVSQKDMAERLKISAEAVNKTVKELTEKKNNKRKDINNILLTWILNVVFFSTIPIASNKIPRRRK